MAARAEPLILVVDDEPINLRVVEDALHDGHRVMTATDGAAALALAGADDPPDLVLLDVRMPGMDGYEVCRRLKEDAATRDIPVIFVTTLGDTESEALGLDAGAVDYIVKPINQRTLRARVRTHLELKRAREQVATLSRIDGLTGIANRRAFDDAFAKEWRRNLRDATPIAVVMIDIDRFKDFNDRYGHPAGDECLRRVARALAATMRRPTDVAARYGGEEFVAVLTNTGLGGARRVADDVRRRVSALELDGGARVSVSCGVAAMVPDSGVDAADLVARADAKLYAAKSRGRDCIVS